LRDGACRRAAVRRLDRDQRHAAPARTFRARGPMPGLVGGSHHLTKLDKRIGSHSQQRSIRRN